MDYSNVNDDIINMLKEVFLKKLKNNPSHYVFNTLWLIYTRGEKRIIGEFCFNTPPNEMGETEVYFDIQEKFRKQGYMKEALGKILEWCSQSGKIKKMMTTVENSNIDAEKLLVAFNFIKEPETNFISNWVKTFE